MAPKARQPAISYNPEMHARTKHIDRRHFFVRECVENMQLRVPFVKTVDNLADFFTKPLPKTQFYKMRDALMNVPPRLRMPSVVAECTACGDLGTVKGEPCYVCSPEPA